MKAPGRHRAGRVAVARPGIYPGRPSCGAGGAGLLGPGVCGLGGADTLNIGYSLWQDCPCIVPPRVSSDTSAADEGDSIPTLSSDGRFSTIPALTAAPRWRIEWLDSPSFPAAGVAPPRPHHLPNRPDVRSRRRTATSAATNCPRTWPASASPDTPNAATAATHRR